MDCKNSPNRQKAKIQAYKSQDILRNHKLLLNVENPRIFSEGFL